MTDVAWQHCCCATCQISKRLENSKYQFHAFCYSLKTNNTLRYCCVIVISDHISYTDHPKGYTGHPAIHRGWPVGRRRICDFGQHWMNVMIDHELLWMLFLESSNRNTHNKKFSHFFERRKTNKMNWIMQLVSIACSLSCYANTS